MRILATAIACSVTLIVGACSKPGESPVEYSTVREFDGTAEEIIQAAFDSMPPVDSKEVFGTSIQARYTTNCETPASSPIVTGDVLLQARDGRYRLVWRNIRFGNGELYTPTLRAWGNDCRPAFNDLDQSIYSSMRDSKDW